MSSSILIQHLLTGISLGGAYSLIAIGYTMVYGILKLINFSHGELFMMSGYFMVFSMAVFPWYISVPVTIIATIALAVLIERIAYRPLRTAPRMSVLISAIGVSYFLQNFATYLFTALPRTYPEIPGLKKIFRFGEVSASMVTIITPIITVVLVILLMQLINHTKIGIAMRATSRDQETARLMGININRVILFTFVVGSFLAGLGSILYFTDRMAVHPFSGTLPGLKCFVAAVIGGIGNIPGAVLGGFILGLGETALIALGYSTFSDAFMFLALIIMLLVRPNGILGEKQSDKV